MSEKIRVLHITTSLNSNGGIEETIRILCRRLDPNRFRIGFCSIQDRPLEILEEFRQMDVEIFCIERRGYFFDFITISQIKNVIKKFKADVVHTHRNKGNLHGRLAAVLTPGTAIVTTHHDMGDISFSRTPALKKRKQHNISASRDNDCSGFIDTVMYPFLNVELNRLNAKVIAVSNSVRNIYTSNLGDNCFETVYSPYDETMYTPYYNGLRKSQISLGVVGRLTWHKGLMVLLHAMKILVQIRDDIRLKIIGNGDLKPKLDAFIHKNGLNPYVHLYGDLPHRANLYDNIDIYIQPSVSEGCSITLLEAMGVGIPVIASDIDGPKELITHNKTGILVPPDNPDALKDAIIDLIEDKEKAFKIGKAGNKRACENFSSKIFIEKMTRIYQELFHQKRGVKASAFYPEILIGFLVMQEKI